MPRTSPFVIDLNVKEGHEGYNTLCKCPPPLGMKSRIQQEKALKAQGPGATRPAMTVAQQTALATKRKSKALSMAMQPGQQILMNYFMMWMSGNSLNIFSINIVMSAVTSPITAIMKMENMFSQFQGVDVQMPKLVFLALNLAWLGIGLYKMSTMRLLPTTSADWTHKIVWKEMMETTSIPPDNYLM